MKISTDNGTIRNAFGDVEAVRMIREAGFDGVDYTFYGIRQDQDILALPDGERYALACRVRECAEKVGLAFPQSHAALAYKYGEPYDSKNYTDILRSMEFAHWLGIKSIVIHSVRCPRRDYTIDPWQVNYGFLRSFLPYAEKYDLQIGVENLFTYDPKVKRYFGRHAEPNDMLAFIKYLDDPRFEICCDMGHCAICGTEAEDFIRGVNSKLLTMLHVQDTDYMGDRHWLPFMGQHNWPAICQALAETGYTGYMNLEVLHFYEMFPQELLPSALRLAADAARYLAGQVEKARKENKA